MWILIIIGGYFFIGLLLGVNTLRKVTTKTDISQKAAVIAAAMFLWGYFFVQGIKKYKDGK